MPDITKGKTFTSGETVTASEMNSLVDDAVINASAVTESKIAAGAVTNAKIAASAGSGLDKLASGTDGQIPICSATGVPTYVTLTGANVTNAGVVSLSADSVATSNIIDSNVTTAKILDANITTAKLAVLDPSPAGSFTNSSVTVNSAGQVTAASSGAVTHPTMRVQAFFDDGTWTAPTGVTRAKFTIVGSGGSGCTSGHGGGGGGTCIVSAAVTAGTGYAVGVGDSVNQSNASNGSAGNASTVVIGATTYTGGGGGGGNSSNRGNGGTATNGDVNIPGELGVHNDDSKRTTRGRAYVNIYGQGGSSLTGDTESEMGFVLVEWLE